jgi:hypothetical protein
MNLRCVTKSNKFKNLTVDKVYDGNEEDDNYVVTNDSGLPSRYAKKYFALSDVVNVRSVDTNGRFCITINGREYEFEIILSSSAISCGINQLSNISNLKTVVRRVTNTSKSTADIFRTVIEFVLGYYREHNPAMCYLISDQLREEDVVMDRVLDELASVSEEAENPNSNHQICLWVIK